jgi:hypothetical protein
VLLRRYDTAEFRRALMQSDTEIANVLTQKDWGGALGPMSLIPDIKRTAPSWADGTRAEADAVIWRTGFKAALTHLAPLGVSAMRPASSSGSCGPSTTLRWLPSDLSAKRRTRRRR